MRLETGIRAPEFCLRDMHGGWVGLSDYAGQRLLLQFHRFAGCPSCNLHVHSFVRRRLELEAAGIKPIMLFHSSHAQLARSMAGTDFPFPILADPGKTAFRRYGVERSVSGLFSAAFLRNAMRGMLAGHLPNPLAQGGVIGLPADFLVSAAGCIEHAHYGRHAADALGVDTVLMLAQEASPAESGAAAPA